MDSYNFSISVNATTNIFGLRQTNNVGNLSNPFSISANSTLLTVTIKIMSLIQENL